MTPFRWRTALLLCAFGCAAALPGIVAAEHTHQPLRNGLRAEEPIPDVRLFHMRTVLCLPHVHTLFPPLAHTVLHSVCKSTPMRLLLFLHARRNDKHHVQSACTMHSLLAHTPHTQKLHSHQENNPTGKNIIPTRFHLPILLPNTRKVPHLHKKHVCSATSTHTQERLPLHKRSTHSL